SSQLNGTYVSAQSISRLGSVIPAWRYTSAAQSRPACGSTWLRRGKMPGSERTAAPWTHAGGCPLRVALASFVMTIATAPSEDGHVSRYRIGSHNIFDATTASNVMSGIWTCAY